MEWVDIPFSRPSFRPRNWTCVSRIVGWFFTIWVTKDKVWSQQNMMIFCYCLKGFPNSLDGKESVYNAGVLGLVPGSRRSPGEGNGNPFQYSCLENSMDRGAWWATVHGVTKSQTRLSDGACKYQYVCYFCLMNSASTRGVEVSVRHPGEDIWAWAWPKIWQEDKDVGESTARGKRREGSLETWVQILREQQY